MKTIKFFKHLFFTALLTNTTLGHAFLGIPGTPKIPGDPLDTARHLERMHKCDQVRSDANHHQAEIRSALSSIEKHLISTSADIVACELDLKKSQLILEEFQLYQNFFSELEGSEKQIASEVQELKAKLFAINSKPNFEIIKEILGTLQQEDSLEFNESMKFIEALLTENQSDISDMLVNHDLESRMHALISTISRIEVSSSKRYVLMTNLYEQKQVHFEELNSRKTSLQNEIKVLQANWNAQEERKSCKF